MHALVKISTCPAACLSCCCQQIVKGRSSYLGDALEMEQNPVVTAVSQATTLVALAVPVILLSFSDTGLIFSLVGAAVSALEGFQRGVGSIK